MIFLFVELVSFGGYQQMAKKKKRKSYPRPPMSEETKAKIKASLEAGKVRRAEEERWNNMDIRAQLGETLFGRNGEKI